MNVQDSIAILREHNEWRRGIRTDNWERMPYSPAEIGLAIDVVCGHVEKMMRTDCGPRHDKPCWCEKCFDDFMATKGGAR